ncbi:16S rRNA (uracil(1498)-N(3))-methyltransferase [Flaviaesturariibacter flavus]|uniref:Ribosomal RNA small subunit methyltransferase E n=1 Tax=Flaviaesturariibacter flavus TaxID=2502780 RepID=A0A4R1BBK2_9BACT|nr:RsmE family RNA methyltransferase [Flaviaesturariibacter flavus]TCJ14379.1 16S rRNA (uracil(1498)-N(3))-methyltransferase [Flaviaesturariibacter flavus]
MALPYFYIETLDSNDVQLDEPTSKHVVSVLRMTKGEELLLTDGKGLKARAVIEDDNRKRCAVRIVERHTEAPLRPHITVAISLVKNAARFEWFLEKATEIGVSEIIPLVCARTEKEKFRADRLQGILQSAMLQSQQCWMPLLREPLPFSQVLAAPVAQRFIAHCAENEKRPLQGALTSGDRLILVGPEGDFTHREIDDALAAGFVPVSLGETRLRTETAGMVAAVLLRNL